MKFEEDYPDLYGEFLIESSSCYQRFLLVSKFTKSIDVEESGSFRKLQEEITRIGIQAEKIVALTNIHLLNDLLLELTQFQAIAEWDQEVAEAKLKQACGTKLGIKDICKWQRTKKPKTVFDAESFSKKHPERYIDYLADPITKTYVRLTNAKTRISD